MREERDNITEVKMREILWSAGENTICFSLCCSQAIVICFPPFSGKQQKLQHMICIYLFFLPYLP